MMNTCTDDLLTQHESQILLYGGSNKIVGRLMGLLSPQKSEYNEDKIGSYDIAGATIEERLNRETSPVPYNDHPDVRIESDIDSSATLSTEATTPSVRKNGGLKHTLSVRLPKLGKSKASDNPTVGGSRRKIKGRKSNKNCLSLQMDDREPKDAKKQSSLRRAVSAVGKMSLSGKEETMSPYIVRGLGSSKDNNVPFSDDDVHVAQIMEVDSDSEGDEAETFYVREGEGRTAVRRIRPEGQLEPTRSRRNVEAQNDEVYDTKPLPRTPLLKKQSSMRRALTALGRRIKPKHDGVSVNWPVGARQRLESMTLNQTPGKLDNQQSRPEVPDHSGQGQY